MRVSILAERLEALNAVLLDKHDSVNRIAQALAENGLTFIAAQKLHRRWAEN
jgi:anthranilate phosphoribosyltransferase